MMTNTTPPFIELRNISVARNGRRVLHNLNLRIEAGEHVAIMGPNGSGKSTLIKTITREFYPLREDGSSMKLFGEESWDVSSVALDAGNYDDRYLRFLCARYYRGRCRSLRIFQQCWPGAASQDQARNA